MTKAGRRTFRFKNPTNFYEAVYRIVERIPEGRVMTYGQIATILGAPRASRAVGYALRACPESLPWQRVINAQGKISARGDVERPDMQRLLLEDEGVHFGLDESCELGRLRWEPNDPESFSFETPENLPF
ncbi:MAG: MGMT family protein [Candidatus Hydrogenedentota bacterium]